MLSLRFQVDGYIKYVGLDLSTKLTILLLFYYKSSWVILVVDRQNPKSKPSMKALDGNYLQHL